MLTEDYSISTSGITRYHDNQKLLFIDMQERDVCVVWKKLFQCTKIVSLLSQILLLTASYHLRGCTKRILTVNMHWMGAGMVCYCGIWSHSSNIFDIATSTKNIWWEYCPQEKTHFIVLCVNTSTHFDFYINPTLNRINNGKW